MKKKLNTIKKRKKNNGKSKKRSINEATITTNIITNAKHAKTQRTQRYTLTLY